MNTYLVATFGVGGGPLAVSTLGFFGGGAGLSVAVVQADNQVLCAMAAAAAAASFSIHIAQEDNTAHTVDLPASVGFSVTREVRLWRAHRRTVRRDVAGSDRSWSSGQ